jgi:hypothetical protein
MTNEATINKRKADNWYTLRIKKETAEQLNDLMLAPFESYNSVISRLIQDSKRLEERKNTKFSTDLSLEQIDRALQEMTFPYKKQNNN